MMKALLGTKEGMTQVFAEDGTVTPVTVIQAGPCVVTQKKTQETDGYSATQIAYKDVSPKKVNMPRAGHFKKAGVSPKKHVAEVTGEHEVAVGDEVTVAEFAPGDEVKVSGVSKGKGFQGVVRRHGYSGGPASHGSRLGRIPGSIGASADPARVFPGTELPGQMGNCRVTQVGLAVVDVDPEQGLLMVKGAVPGHKGSLVMIRG